jgi:coenzyme F420-0:L-glutamate ligase/coenzyme F420-1:gamma-L-glutamate ligase
MSGWQRRGDEAMDELRAIPLRGMREFRAGDSVAEEVLRALRRQKLRLGTGDILIVTHKIVSKAEERLVRLKDVKATRPAQRWARRYGLDARVVELALRESVRVVRMQHGVLITETEHGLVCANSGVDVSNVDGGRSAVLLPEDPDASAERLRVELKKRTGREAVVIITDSFGRPWREGLCQVAIGVAGMKAMRDFRGRRDPHGYKLRVTEEAVADELAALGALACDKLARAPVCLVRGFRYPRGGGRARELVRPARKDLFR